MSKLYLFCIPTSRNVQILRGLYLLLASGCKFANQDEDFAIRPLFIMQPNLKTEKELKDLEQLRLAYEGIRSSFNQDKESSAKIFCTRLIEPYAITNEREKEIDNSVEFLNCLFQGEHHVYAKGLEWEQLFRSNSPNVHVRITEQDSVLFLLSADHPEQAVFAKLLFEKKWIKRVSNKGLIVDMCPGTTDQTLDLLRYGLSQISGVRQLFVSDSGKPQFDQLLVASAITEFSSTPTVSSVAAPPKRRVEFYELYGIDDIPDHNVRNCLIRFHLFFNIVSNKYQSDTKTWQSNYNYRVNSKDNALLERFKKFAVVFNDWQQGMRNEFHLYLGEDSKSIKINQRFSLDLKEMFKYMNKLESPKSWLNNAQKKQALCASMVESAYRTQFFASPNTASSDAPFALLDSIPPDINDWRQIPNPFALFLYYRKAFEQKEEKGLLQERSFCLDFWELFFDTEKRAVENYFSVEECSLKSSKNGHYWDVLSSYKEFNNIITSQVDVCYFIKDRDGKVVAYSSPYTGFCVRHDIINEVRIGSRIYFSSDSANWKELAERDLEIRLFMRRYVELVPAFSSSFVQYIDASLSSQERVLAASSYFFDAYSRFRRHVPVM